MNADSRARVPRPLAARCFQPILGWSLASGKVHETGVSRSLPSWFILNDPAACLRAAGAEPGLQGSCILDGAALMPLAMVTSALVATVIVSAQSSSARPEPPLTAD